MLLLMCHTADPALRDWALSSNGDVSYCHMLAGFRGRETMEQTVVRLLGLLCFQRLVSPLSRQEQKPPESTNYLQDFDKHIKGQNVGNSLIVFENMAFSMKLNLPEQWDSSVCGLLGLVPDSPILQGDKTWDKYWKAKMRERLSHQEAWSVAWNGATESRGILMHDGSPWDWSSSQVHSDYQ
jgi:hypothetical protein